MSADLPNAPSEPAEHVFRPHEGLDDRLGLPLAFRAFALSVTTFCSGLVLGVLHTSKMAALRFRAENSHRFPTTTRGWYFYHKSKNYYVMYAGITEGVKTGFRFPPMIMSILFFENAVDKLRGRQDFLSTVIGSLSTAGLFSLKSWPSSMKATCEYQILTSWT